MIALYMFRAHGAADGLISKTGSISADVSQTPAYVDAKISELEQELQGAASDSNDFGKARQAHTGIDSKS
jgi:hypothetical protein